MTYHDSQEYLVTDRFSCFLHLFIFVFMLKKKYYNHHHYHVLVICCSMSVATWIYLKTLLFAHNALEVFVMYFSYIPTFFCWCWRGKIATVSSQGESTDMQHDFYESKVDIDLMWLIQNFEIYLSKSYLCFDSPRRTKHDGNFIDIRYYYLIFTTIIYLSKTNW